MRRLALAGALLAATCGAAAEPAPFTFDDVYGLVALSSPQLAPDGAHALVIVRTADRDLDRWTRRLDVVDLATGARRTVPLPAGSFSSPRWSPRGDRLAFLSGGGVWIGGASGEDATRVTGQAYDVVQFAWRPDGKALAFVAIAPPAPPLGDARYLDGYVVGNDAALARGPRRPATLWVQPLDGGAARQLGPREGSVASGDAESTLSWSPSGTSIAYLHAPTNVANDAVGARVRIVDVATGGERPLPGPADHERDPLYSPDGSRLAYAYSAGDDQLHPLELFVTTPAGGAARNVSHPIDRALRDLAWQPGSSTLWFTATSGTRNALFRSVDGGAPQQTDLGSLSIASGLDGAIASDGTVAFVAQTGRRPDELYLLRPNGAAVRVTDYNAAIAARALAPTRRITYMTSLGIAGDAVLTLPATMRPGRRPLVIVLHGGPTSASTETFDALGQLMAARGWLVLEPNYRGSNNLGARYQRAVGGDKLRGPGADIDAALAAVRRLGIVDERRLAVSGWSYGAGLTLWMIEHRHDWRAAVAGAAVTDIAADYATADDIAADRALAGGSPLVAPFRAKAAAMSPITYAAQVRTPLLLMTCRGDTRVSPVGTYEFFHALRDLGRDVQLVAYPVDGHFPSDPVRRVDVYHRWIDFIAQRFGT